MLKASSCRSNVRANGRGGVVGHTQSVELLLFQVCDLYPLVVDLVVQGFDLVFEFGVIRVQRRALHLQGFESAGELVLLLAGLVGFDLRRLKVVREGLD